MFDSASSDLLRSAPSIGALDAKSLPQLLTRHYAELVSARLRGRVQSEVVSESVWTLDEIADAYELLSSTSHEKETIRACAFVAATAQQIIARRVDSPTLSLGLSELSRDKAGALVCSILLFLIAEQFADANEAARALEAEPPAHNRSVRLLVKRIGQLASGRIGDLVSFAGVEEEGVDNDERASIEDHATACLYERLSAGVVKLARELIGASESTVGEAVQESWRTDFELVQGLSLGRSYSPVREDDKDLTPLFPGVYHIATLLRSAADVLISSSLVKTVAPRLANREVWNAWIRRRAALFPYVWPNHQVAVRQDFHQPGVSAVIVLPTGAGKTTIASLKIAGVLAAGKKVVFLAPTHALVEQLTDDLQRMFPEELFGARVASDSDFLFEESLDVPSVEVMTPERCLALLSFSRESFKNVGLLVFDECHLLSASHGSLRRAIDGMLCVLAMRTAAPWADLLFLSAMVENGGDFANWVESLTGRKCLSVDLLWKPSRQARGLVVFDSSEIANAIESAHRVQSKLDSEKKKKAVELRKKAKAELKARPLAIWGLRHNWLNRKENTAAFSVFEIAKSPVGLGGTIQRGQIRLLPNANVVAASIAADAARSGLKTIVFVNQKNHAVVTAGKIAESLGVTVLAAADEQLLWDELTEELGGLGHAIIKGPVSAVPHNAGMLRLERELAQRMYLRPDGAQVIVATPTLAQGLNLPAHLAILAGDRRADPDEGGRQQLEAHELLNAAARAGRAGHLANGVVLLIPEPPVLLKARNRLSTDAISKLMSILPENDRCVEITDPLEEILDRIQEGLTSDRDVLYALNRFAVARATGDSDASGEIFNMDVSLAAFRAKAEGLESVLNSKVILFRRLVAQTTPLDSDPWSVELASQSGLSIELFARLIERVRRGLGALPVSVIGWVDWLVDWLESDRNARDLLLLDCTSSINACLGRTNVEGVSDGDLTELLPAMRAWLEGRPLNEVEFILGGDPNGSTNSLQICPRARALCGTVMPRGISYAIGLVAAVCGKLDAHSLQEGLSRDTIESLSVCTRIGFDRHQKVRFKFRNPQVLGRVTLHRMFREAEVDF